ncbi:MAG: ParB-like protein [Rhodomicrobium sp.]
MLQMVRAPLSHPIDIAELKPTQMTIGLKEVETRAAKLKALAQEDGEKLVRKHVIPVVKGPKENYYVIDHHHLCRAMLLAGSTQVSVIVVLNLVRLEKDAFWVFMDNSGLVHPFNDEGKRCDYHDIPKSIADMTDDPFRSLAGAMRRKGGYAKDTTPFSEFLWADFLRRRFARKDVENNFEATLAAALDLAKKSDADFLPGWCGPVEEEG